MPWLAGLYRKWNYGTSGWTGDAASGIGIEAGRHDSQDDDFATGINSCLNKDGSNAATGNLNLNGNKIVSLASGTSNTDATNVAQLNALIPAGSVITTAASAAPTGWLLCDGIAYNTYTYRVLHAMISNTYGGTAYNPGTTDQPGALTTFNVPDLRGRVVAGLDNMGGTDAGRLDWANTIGTTGGAQNHTLTTAEMPSHTHTQDAHTHTQNAHNHGLTVGTEVIVSGGGGAAYMAASGAFGPYNVGAIANATATNNNTTATNQNTGGGGAHNNMQPTMLLNYIIKT